MPWLGAGRAAELGRRLGTRRGRHRILVAFPGRVCFPADRAFRGERAVFAGGYTPFRRTSRGRPSAARSARARPADAAGRSVAWHGRYARGAPEEGGEPVAGAGDRKSVV